MSYTATITGMHYVRDGSSWFLVVRMGTKMSDTWTLTIGDNSYDVEDGAYFIPATHSYYEQSVSAQTHIWRVSNPNISANDELAVSIHRPVPQPPSYPAVVPDPDRYLREDILSTTMTVGTTSHTGSTSRRDEYGYFIFGNQFGALDDPTYRYGDTDRSVSSLFYRQRTPTSASEMTTHSLLLFLGDASAELSADVSLYIGGAEYPIEDSNWASSSGSYRHFWTLSERPDWADETTVDVELRGRPITAPNGYPVEGRVTVGSAGPRNTT